MRTLFAALTLLTLAPSALHAQDCSSAASQTAMNQCADQAYRTTDAELHAAYKQITARLKDDRDASRLLLAAQRKWLAFRDAQCAFLASGSAQGSVYPLLVMQCREELTRTRVTEFKGYLHCAEGDLRCPVPAH